MKRINSRQQGRTRSSGPQNSGISNKDAKAAKPRAWEAVKAVPGVTGIGIGGEERNCHLSILFETEVEMEDAKAKNKIPKTIDGVPLLPKVTGQFEAQPQKEEMAAA